MNRKDWDAKKQQLSLQIQNAVVLTTDPELTYKQRLTAIHHLGSLRAELVLHKIAFSQIQEKNHGTQRA